jgi:hypothetical protein
LCGPIAFVATIHFYLAAYGRVATATAINKLQADFVSAVGVYGPFLVHTILTRIASKIPHLLNAGVVAGV